MPELDEYTSSWLAEWSQKQDYLAGCTTITKYEKFMLCFYLLNFIDFIELDKWKFEEFYSQIIQVFDLEKTKYPKYSKTRNYKKELNFKESLRTILTNKLKSMKYKLSEIEKRLIIISNIYSLDNIEYGFLKYYVLKTVTPLIGKLSELFDVSFNEFEIFGAQCLNLKSWVIQQYRKNLLRKGIFIKRGMSDDKIYLTQKIIQVFSDPDIKTETQIKNILLGKNQKSELCWKDFEHIEKERDIAFNILTSAVQTQAKGINILLYGSVGTGKTQLAKLLANKAKIDMYSVSAEFMDKEASRKDRLSDLASKQTILAKTNNSCILFDEAEDVMNRGFTEFGSASKAYLNTLLEETPVPIFWTTNNIYTVANDVLDTNGNVKEDVKVEEIELPEIAEPLKQEVKKIIKQAEPVTFEKLKEVKCVETRIEEKTFTHEQATEIMEELKEMKVISKEGKIKDTMKAQLKAGKLDLSERYTKAAQRAIMQVLEKADNRPVIRDANKEVTVKLKKQAILSPEFKELWDKIKQKTTYRVNIDTDTLIKNCVKELREMPPIPKAKLLTSTAEIEIENAGIYSTEKHIQTTDLENTYNYVPDILRLIASETLLKHSTIIQILKQSGREQDFMNNPQLFYEKALEIILRNRHSLAIDGIKYIKLAGEEYYVQEIFDSEELLANLDRNAVQVEHSVYDYLIYDSGVESRFAKSLDEDPDVKMFFKIPPRFKIETPIGSYNPDWAMFLEKDGEQKLYFVLETKGTTSLLDLRNSEKLKIHCGKQHFAALEDGIEFSEEPVKDWKEFKVNI